jgi:hypothetical protein
MAKSMYVTNISGVLAMKTTIHTSTQPAPKIELQKKTSEQAWNKVKLIGQKSPLKLKEVWEIRIKSKLANNLRGLALFNLAIFYQSLTVGK